MGWPGVLWEEFGLWAAFTAMHCLAGLAVADMARKELPRFYAHVARRCKRP